MRETLILLTGIAVGCAQAPDEPQSAQQRVEAVTDGVQVHPGYQHSLANSEFDVGPSLTQKVVAGRIDVTQGNYGTFSRWPLGQVAALPNADAPVKLRAPLRNPDQHTQRVRAYLVKAGVPEDQIATVNNHAIMSGGGPTTTPELHGALESYTTVLSRSIKGVPIAESFAWAALADDGAVITESVWWPPVPATVVEEALGIGADIASGAFSQKTGVQDAGTVIVHHTIGMGAKLTFIACFQVHPSSLGANRCYGASGSVVDLDAALGGP
ncbi:MAG: hypothetical protein AMXMBFR56_51290 [Polyangiaceae bacterium]